MSDKLVYAPSDVQLLERDVGKMPVLECKHMGIQFGGLKAVDDFNITIGPTEICGLIGPNGAGKTTVFNVLTKIYEPTSGTALINGQDIKGKKIHQVNHMGIARTFQNIRLFNNLTVLDNIVAAMDSSVNYGFFEGILRLPAYYKEEEIAKQKAMELLKLFDMENVADELASSLPYGAQRRVEIVRALATNPKLLLLDEPAAGMNPAETAELMENIRKIRDTFQIAVLLIEHDMSLVMGVCDSICVLSFGKVIAKGTPDDIKNNPTVIEAYLGKSEE